MCTLPVSLVYRGRITCVPATVSLVYLVCELIHRQAIRGA